MEHNDIKKKWKDWVFKIVAIAILLFIAYQLIEIRQKVKEHYEAFDENPLLFGAKKYGIVDGRAITSSGETFYFNQEKMWRDAQVIPRYTNSINFSLWGNQT